MHVISLLLILVIMVQLAILRLTVPYLGRGHNMMTMLVMTEIYGMDYGMRYKVGKLLTSFDFPRYESFVNCDTIHRDCGGRGGPGWRPKAVS